MPRARRRRRPPRARRPLPPEPSTAGLAPRAAAPPSTRTRFAVTLQLGRAYASLVALVRDAERNHYGVLAVHAQHIASIILGGARDRSRDRHQRPLRDQQSRTEPLTSTRTPRKAYPRTNGRKGQGPRPLSPPRGEGRRRSKALIKKRRRARTSLEKAKARGTM